MPPIHASITTYSCLTGPYAPAVLRFQISFPSTYPSLPPLVTFSTDVFHPLLTPLTTYTYTTGSSDTDTVSATDEERLPPGGFSLRHGFPGWFGRTQRSISTPRQVSASSLGSPIASDAPLYADGSHAPPDSLGTSLSSRGIPIVRILEYIRSTFSEESVLDSLPLGAAANPGAYHAWRTYRSPNQDTDQLSPALPSSDSPSDSAPNSAALGRNRRPGEWNWEGVWEERVGKAIKNSLSEPVLFGTGVGDDIVGCIEKLKLKEAYMTADSFPRRR